VAKWANPHKTLLAALVEAGIIVDPANTRRVLIDITGNGVEVHTQLFAGPGLVDVIKALAAEVPTLDPDAPDVSLTGQKEVPACGKRDRSGHSCIQQLANGWHGPADLCPVCTARFMAALDDLGEELDWHRSFAQRAAGGGS
jgi:hypothetical protein